MNQKLRNFVLKVTGGILCFSYENQIHLTKSFRQKDPIYTKILNQVREGVLKRSSNEILLKQVGKPKLEDTDILPTKLYPRRYSVENVNNSEMKKIIYRREVV